MKRWRTHVVAVVALWELACRPADAALRMDERRLPLAGSRRSFLERMPNWLVANVQAPTTTPLPGASTTAGMTTTGPLGFATTTGPLGFATTTGPLGFAFGTTTGAFGTTGLGLATSLPFTTSLGPGAPSGAPEPETTTTTPMPPCNWTKDWEGVARPLHCFTVYDSTAVYDGGPNAYRVACRTGHMFSEDMNCTAPAVRSCPPFPKLHSSENYKVTGQLVQHGALRNVTCQPHAAPIDVKYPMETWGQDKYQGGRKSRISCNNGTWTNVDHVNALELKPHDLICASHEQISLLIQMDHDSKWAGKKLNDTLALNFSWIDFNAIGRKAALQHALEWTPKLIQKALQGEVPSVKDLKIVVDSLSANTIVPRGEKRTEKTCKDLEKHFLWELDPKGSQVESGGVKLGFKNYVPGEPLSEKSLVQPVSFKCSFAMQKTPLGFDYITRTTTYIYRDGCFCETRWTNLCPFRTELSPSYRYFGFNSLDEKKISTALGAPSNALCWYWSDATHPEWGYVHTEYGYAYQAPSSNATDLMRAWNKKADAQAEARAAEAKAAEAKQTL